MKDSNSSALFFFKGPTWEDTTPNRNNGCWKVDAFEVQISHRSEAATEGSDNGVFLSTQNNFDLFHMLYSSQTADNVRGLWM